MTRADQITAQDERFHPPTRNREGAEILDIDYYAPFLLNAVASAWGRQTSAIYRRDFGLGLTDWRVLAMLNIEPGITASRVCDVIRMDKAAVSRSLKTLNEMGHLRHEQPGADPRKRLWWLSDRGLQVHAEILAVALGCEADLIRDIAPEDLETFLKVMRQMLANIDPK
ncbi:MarR family winged helix-turn-helix transcriptional regulator [Oceanicola sp. 502str15]|uniref:MarR family winged helix-turn-helix transcriptional regulator n=1 Tax=Oceanicola sp. 502str15 TaxID=2696061 RepID=UPI0020958711|nr:MarR family winged helix-turn-helix transcriptional regulator [Oceanicola sp. 502str15]MCO6384640.1 MarR family transcriptional regulator [Oceanicola sp. 502str15]